MNKYMRAYASINREALINNLCEIHRLTPPDTLVMPVIKADAYGHSALEVAKTIEDYADYFAVAIIEEAIFLRKNGINKPIMLLGYTSPENFYEAVKNKITLTLFTFSAAEKLSAAAMAERVNAKIHIAVDTGMSRIGFSCTDKSIEEIEKIYNLPNIEIEGIFTHFAAADEKERSFTELQLKRYNDFTDKLSAAGIKIPLRHAANSAAIMEYPQAAFNMVRPGIITYGLYPSSEVTFSKLRLKPVMELKTHVVYVKNIYKGDTVSYGRTFTADKEIKIATIPIGYADGYPRLLSNKGRVIINGQYAPIIGRICMDQFMADVSDIENVCEGDIVTLIGRDGDCFISTEEIASLTNTINYEIVCGIGKRVPRIFI